MAKKAKVQTPAWILEGYDSPADYNKAKGINKKEKKVGSGLGSSKTLNSGNKTFKIRECPKCKSNDVGVVLSGSDSETGGGKDWECRKCKWKGKDIIERDLTENELMKYLDKKGEKIA